MPPAVLEGVFFLWRGAWLLISDGATNQPHRHVAASLLAGLDGPVTVTVSDQVHRAEALLVAPEAVQSLDTDGRPALIMHLDPDHPDYLSLKSRLSGQCAQLPGEPLRAMRGQALALRETPSCAAARSLADALIRAWGDTPEPLDERVASVAGHLREALPERLDVAGLAASVSLSESRLSHLFREETGVTLKRFLLNLKVQQAMACWEPGMTLTEVSATAGFYDQPHLARTIREMFDVLPSRYFSDGGNIRVLRCAASD
jgi:AraC family transcriptional regulator of arabinose operon